MRRYKKRLTCGVIAILTISSLAGCGETQTKQPARIDIVMPEESEEAEIFVASVENISDDFIRGMDASSVLAVENSGAKYYNFAGEEQDVFLTLAQAGVNYIRLRVWNDPYDVEGHGYGGGNNDLATAIALGQRASQYGMKVCIDFHYSDFWADPKKQIAPKAWENMAIEEKAQALYDYTTDSLKQLLEAGVDVGIVQIGNEINSGMSGENSVTNVMQLLDAGSKAVRAVATEVGKDIRIAVHYTNIQDQNDIKKYALDLRKNEIDYDIFAVSYYPYWHGDFANLQEVLAMLHERFEKKVMIAETSYCYTSEDGDGYGNSIEGKSDLVAGYPATVQGQADFVRDVMEQANIAGALGVFYWEGTWIPVGPASADNSAKWEEFGSGWASSFASDYDPKDAGPYYGGCSWDNQAMFDFEGHPLPSLNVFKYLKYGATAELVACSVADREVTVQGGDMAEDATMEIYAITGGEEYTESFMVDGWCNWKTPEIPAIEVTDGTLIIGARYHCNPISWGTIDEFTVNQMVE